MASSPTPFRIASAGLAASLVAVLAIYALQLLAVAAFDIDPGFTPIRGPTALVATSIAGAGATIVLGLLFQRVERPVDEFLRISTIVFTLSLAPPLALLVLDGPYPGTTTAAILTLLAMHVAAALSLVAVSLAILTQQNPVALRRHGAGVNDSMGGR